MICPFCHDYIPGLDDAERNDWVLGYWTLQDGRYYFRSRPVCPDCASDRLALDDDGELIERQG